MSDPVTGSLFDCFFFKDNNYYGILDAVILYGLYKLLDTLFLYCEPMQCFLEIKNCHETYKFYMLHQ